MWAVEISSDWRCIGRSSCKPLSRRSLKVTRASVYVMIYCNRSSISIVVYP